MTDIHFEVFVRKAARGSWQLANTFESRKAAITFAKELAEARPRDGIRVIKEMRDHRSGQFRGVAIFSRGENGKELPHVKKEDPLSLLCFQPKDLYSSHAREIISNLLRAFLDRQKVTVHELLHRGDLLIELSESGSELQHAIQKYAMSLSNGTEGIVHDVIRQLQDLTKRVISKVYHDDLDRKFPVIELDYPEKALAKAAASEEPSYIFSGSLANFLKDIYSPIEKLVTIIRFVNRIFRLSNHKVLGLRVADNFLSEALISQVPISDLIGLQESLLESLMILTDLYCGHLDDQMITESGIPKDCLTELSKLIGSYVLPEAKRAVGKKILTEIRSKRPLCLGELPEQILAARALEEKINNVNDDSLAEGEIKEAFQERFSQFIRRRTIENYIAKIEAPDNQFIAILEIAHDIDGAQNRDIIANYAKDILYKDGFLALFNNRDIHVVNRMKRLVTLQNSVKKTPIDLENQEKLISYLDRLALKIAAHEDVFNNIVRRSCPGYEKALTVLKMSADAIFTEGEVSAQAAQIVRENLPNKDISERVNETQEGHEMVQELCDYLVSTRLQIGERIS